MIIQCEKCGTKFNFDDKALKKEGSRVRCSVCKQVFVAYLEDQVEPEEGTFFSLDEKDLDLDEGTTEEEQEDQVEPEEEAFFSLDEGTTKEEQEDQDIDFDKAFEESVVDIENAETVQLEELPDSEEEAGGAEKPADRTDLEEPALADIEERGEEIFTGETETPSAAPVQDRRTKSHFLPVLLVIILLLMGSAAAIRFWAPPRLVPGFLSFLKPVEKPQIADMGVRRLSFKAVTGSFVASEKAGRLFVIQGMVKNNYPKSRSFIRIKGTILDEKGQVVKKKLVYAGNTFKEEEIKELSLEEIEKAMGNRYGMGGKNFNVVPGVLVPFMIIFGDLPEGLSEFTVEAVSSSLGT